MTTGKRDDAKWFKEELQKIFQIKTQTMGLGPEEKREGRVLNRIVRISGDGWEYEAGQRHADLIIKGSNMTEAQSAKTPGEETKKDQEDEDAEELNKNGGKEFRGLAARANYLSADRGDMQYAVKELCRGMAAPTRGECKKSAGWRGILLAGLA